MKYYSFDFIQAHNDTFQISTFSKKISQLLFGGVEAQVSNVQCGRSVEQTILFFSCPLRLILDLYIFFLIYLELIVSVSGDFD